MFYPSLIPVADSKTDVEKQETLGIKLLEVDRLDWNDNFIS